MIELPPPRRPANNEIRNRSVPVVEHQTTMIEGSLKDLLPLDVRIVEPRNGPAGLFNCLLQTHQDIGTKSGSAFEEFIELQHTAFFRHHKAQGEET